MQTTTQTVNKTRRRTEKERTPCMSWDRWVLDLKREAPELLAPYDVVAIREELISRITPRSVLEHLIDARLILDRDVFDSNFVPKRRDRAAKRVEQTKVAETITRVDTLAKRQALASFDLEMPMGDGRVLGDWTIAELRTLNGAFAVILDRVGDGNDSRRVRDALAQ